MKFRLSVAKSITIDLSEKSHKGMSVGEAWAEMVLENLRTDDPSAQIDSVDVDTLTGALVRVVQDDPDACIQDLDLGPDANDFRIEVLDKPKVYVASKIHHAPIWRKLRDNYAKRFEFTSTWINTDISPMIDSNTKECRDSWKKNIEDVCRSDFLIAYGNSLDFDPLSGTLVEIGAMLAKGGRVYLLGDYDWKTWQHHPLITVCDPRRYGLSMNDVVDDLLQSL